MSIEKIKMIKLNDNMNSLKVNLNKDNFSTNLSSYSLNNDNVSVLDFCLEDVFNVDSIDYSNIKEDGFTVQGYTVIDGEVITNDGKVLITAYDREKINNSRIYIYNAKNGKFEGEIILNNMDHVGGVTMDSVNQILYVTGSDGKVNTYDFKELSSAIDEVKEIIDGTYIIDLNIDDSRGYIVENDISVKGLVSDNNLFSQNGMDSVYFYNGVLYSNTYSGNGELVRTELDVIRDVNGNIVEIKEIASNVVAKVGGAVQGLAFYNKDGVDYLVTASSSLITSSKLSLFELCDDGTLIKDGAIVIEHKGLEGISINENGDISGIFEYGEQETSIVSNIEELKNNSTGEFINNFCLDFSGMIWDIIN